MAKINTKLIKYATQALFDIDIAKVPAVVDPKSIVFVEDTGRIYAHGKYFGGAWEDITDKPDTFTPSAHSHGPITNDGKIGTSANRIIETTTGGALTHVAKNTAYNRAFGTGANQVAMGNHTHDYAGLNTLPTNTKRDFVNGTLITTNINYANASGDPFYMTISGNSYGRRNSVDTVVQGYIYNNTIINYGVTHKNPHGITGIVAMNVGGKLCFWFPRQGYWEGYSIMVTTAINYNINTITGITDVVKPVGTKEVNLSLNTKQAAFHNDNLSNFTDNIGVATHIANKSNPHNVTTAQIGAVDLTTNQSIGGVKTFTGNVIAPSFIGALSGNATSAGMIKSIRIAGENDALPSSSNSSQSFSVTTTSATGGDGFITGYTWSGGNWAAQIYIDVDPTYNISIRHRNSAGTWVAWKKIWTEANLTASALGLGNVTNESKATMFTNPTFTGTVKGVTKSHVGLGNVDNTADSVKNVLSATKLPALNTYDANEIIGGAAFNYNSAAYWVNGPSGMSYGLIGNIISRGSNELSLQLASDINHNSTSSTKDLWFRTGNNLGFQNDWKKV